MLIQWAESGLLFIFFFEMKQILTSKKKVLENLVTKYAHGQTVERSGGSRELTV